MPGLPIAEHFNAAGHPIVDVLVREIFALRSDLPTEAAFDAPDFKLGMGHPRGLISLGSAHAL